MGFTAIQELPTNGTNHPKHTSWGDLWTMTVWSAVSADSALRLPAWLIWQRRESIPAGAQERDMTAS